MSSRLWHLYARMPIVTSKPIDNYYLTATFCSTFCYYCNMTRRHNCSIHCTKLLHLNLEKSNFLISEIPNTHYNGFLLVFNGNVLYATWTALIINASQGSKNTVLNILCSYRCDTIVDYCAHIACVSGWTGHQCVVECCCHLHLSPYHIPPLSASHRGLCLHMYSSGLWKESACSCWMPSNSRNFVMLVSQYSLCSAASFQQLSYAGKSKGSRNLTSGE